MREPGLQGNDGWSFEANLDVAPLVRASGVAAPVISDASATGKRQLAVDDQGLAMRAVVEAAEGVPADRVVPGDLTTAGFEHIEDLGADR